jgi:hypothetical protein
MDWDILWPYLPKQALVQKMETHDFAWKMEIMSWKWKYNCLFSQNRGLKIIWGWKKHVHSHFSLCFILVSAVLFISCHIYTWVYAFSTKYLQIITSSIHLQDKQHYHYFAIPFAITAYCSCTEMNCSSFVFFCTIRYYVGFYFS